MSESDGKTREIRDAEAMLEEAMLKVEQSLAAAEQLNASLPEHKLDQGQIDQIEQLVRDGKAPAEIKALQERVDAGELSWQDIANGKGIDDEGVQQAFQAGIPNMQYVKELLDEGQSAEDIINADPNKSAADLDDDDFGEEPESFMDSGKW